MEVSNKEEQMPTNLPACLSNGSNKPLPRDYIKNWKVTDSNKDQRMSELVYTLNMLRSKGMQELVIKSELYEKDFL